MNDFLGVMAWVGLVAIMVIAIVFFATAATTATGARNQKAFKECLQQGASPEYCFKVAD